MTTVHGGQPLSIYPRLADTGGRIPFGLIDTNGSGRVSKAELGIALQRIFPSLSDRQCSAIADGAFSTLRNNGMVMDRDGWMVAEEVVLQSAKSVDQSNAIQRGSAPSGWLDETGTRPNAPMIVGQNQIPLPPVMQPGAYMPRNDAAITGYNPYQYPMAMPPMVQPYEHHGAAKNLATGAGRGVLGFLKMLPVVGNVINGFDFLLDIPKAIRTWTNPTVPFQQKLKAGSDLLAHGAGMFIPQVGGAYDMAQSAARIAGGAAQAVTGYNPATGDISMYSRLPPYQFNRSGYDPLYNMQYAQRPGLPTPYSYGTFPNYSQFPPYPAGLPFQPPFMQSQYQMPFPQLPYGPNIYNYPNFDPYMGAPFGQHFNPYMMNMGPHAAMTDPMFGTSQDGLKGAGRAVIGGVKFAASALPVVGNILNGIDFVRDLGQLGRAFRGDPTSGGVMKNVADLLFHGVGMFIPAVGASYDLAQGTLRAGAAMTNPYNWQARLPPFQPNWAGIPPMYRRDPNAYI